MKVFDCTKEFPNKVNFVDKNNVVLGYNLDQQCCECAGWFVSDVPHLEATFPKDENDNSSDEFWEGYEFDTSYQEEAFRDEVGILIFKAVKLGSPDRYIHMYNVHNGYYGHGWNWSNNGKEIEGGVL